MLRVGLIGCGYMGTMHAKCYKHIKDSEVVAVADIRRERAKELAEGTNAVIYTEGKELIENASVDVIDICLPTYLHTEYAILAMKKVRYLFVEKPVALTKEQCEKMLQMEKETGCKVQVGLVIRFWDEYVKLRDIVESGIYGKVVNANFRRISPKPTWGWNNWLLNPDLSGGAAQDLHIHDVDYILSLFGMPHKVLSAKNTLGEKNSYISSLFSYNDFLVSVEGTWGLPENYPFRASFRVVFENGAVEFSDGKLMLYSGLGAESIEIDKKQVSDVGCSGGNISDLGGYYNELTYFIDCAKNNLCIEKAPLSEAARSLFFILEPGYINTIE